MNDGKPPQTDEGRGLLGPAWTVPVSQGQKPRPATIHEGFSFAIGEEFGALAPWDSSALPLYQPSVDPQSRPGSVQSFHQQTPFSNSGIMDSPAFFQKQYDDGGYDYSQDMPIGQAITADEAIPVMSLGLGYADKQNGEPHYHEDAPRSRRMSGSSFTLSTSGPLSDINSYDDFSAMMSDSASHSDFPPTSNRNSYMSQLSPVASPRLPPQTRSDMVRTQSRGRASPSPRPNARSAPYSVDGPRNKRWSTGSTPQRRPAPAAYQSTQEMFANQQQQMMLASQQSMHPDHPALHYGPGPMQHFPQPTFATHGIMSQYQRNSSNNFFMPSQMPTAGFQPTPPNLDNPPTLMSQGFFASFHNGNDHQTLHSNNFAHACEPPNIYSALNEEQEAPGPEYMNPEDKDMMPHEQDVRFEGDMYTPRWVRGTGNKREGWCGICKPGRWLVLKNSAYWYDKSFTHGISAATGSAFQEPLHTRLMEGGTDSWEGFCGTCHEWVALVSHKKKGTTWFRHAYKCHSHPKIKDGPKRRRDASATRALPASQMAKPNTEVQAPITPQMTPAALPTPTPGQMSHNGHLQQRPRPPSSHLFPDNAGHTMSSPLGDMRNMN